MNMLQDPEGNIITEDAGGLSAEADLGERVFSSHAPRKLKINRRNVDEAVSDFDERISSPSQTRVGTMIFSPTNETRSKPERESIDSQRGSTADPVAQLLGLAMGEQLLRAVTESLDAKNQKSKELILQVLHIFEPFPVVSFSLVERIMDKAVVSVQTENWTVQEVQQIQQLARTHVDNEGATQTERRESYYAYSRFLLKCGTSFKDPGPQKLKWIDEAYELLSGMPFFDEIKTTIMYARATVLKARISSEQEGNKILDKAIKRISQQLVKKVGDKNFLLALLKMEKVTRFVCDDIDVDRPEDLALAKTIKTELKLQMKEVREHMQNAAQSSYFHPQMHNALFEYRWLMKKSLLIPRPRAIEKQKKVLRKLREDLHIYLHKIFPVVMKQAETDEWWHECFVMMVDITNISVHLWKDTQQSESIKKHLHSSLKSFVL